MDPEFFPIYVARPCWQCHWFGYLMAENPHGFCVRPGGSGMISIPKNGCAFWLREAGIDDEPTRRPAPLEPGDPARAAIEHERGRLMHILGLAEDESRRRGILPYGFYVDVASREGTLNLTGGHRDHPTDRRQLCARVEALGVNMAVKSGKL